MQIKVSSDKLWTARFHPPRSTAEVQFRSPLVVLPLAVGGCGSGIGRATLEQLRLIHLDQWCSDEFQTPLSILPLMGGGVQNSVACEMGPPLPPVLHLKVHDAIDSVDMRKI
jgi:hypothetical protein